MDLLFLLSIVIILIVLSVATVSAYQYRKSLIKNDPTDPHILYLKIIIVTLIIIIAGNAIGVTGHFINYLT